MREKQRRMGFMIIVYLDCEVIYLRFCLFIYVNFLLCLCLYGVQFDRYIVYHRQYVMRSLWCIYGYTLIDDIARYSVAMYLCCVFVIEISNSRNGRFSAIRSVFRRKKKRSDPLNIQMSIYGAKYDIVPTMNLPNQFSHLTEIKYYESDNIRVQKELASVTKYGVGQKVMRINFYSACLIVLD